MSRRHSSGDIRRCRHGRGLRRRRSYTSPPITMVVPFAARAGSDIIAEPGLSIELNRMAAMTSLNAARCRNFSGACDVALFGYSFWLPLPTVRS
jgi:hypothetical protein